MPTAELPVAWWAFWLVAMAAVVFVGFCWWLLRAAQREDQVQDPPGRSDAEEDAEGRASAEPR